MRTTIRSPKNDKRKHTQTAAAIVAHSLGVKLDDKSAGIFDDWHRDDVARAEYDNRVLRQLAKDDAAEKRELRTSRQCWRVLALLGFGLFIMAAVMHR